jgi:hypothetical protein
MGFFDGLLSSLTSALSDEDSSEEWSVSEMTPEQRRVKNIHDGFEAKYEGSCSRCKEPIEPGDEIETSRGGRYPQYAHVLCSGTADITCSICGKKWVTCDCP